VDARSRDFEEFVRGRSTALLRTAYLLTGNRSAAEDLLQGVLERVYRRWPSISDSPDAYVRRALANAATSRWRRKAPVEVTLTIAHDRAADDRPGLVDLRDQLARGLMSLPARQRAILVLRYFDDMSAAQTADALGCSVGTVKSQTSRGLARLRQLVTDEDSPLDVLRSTR
jgi:RNA polymerase sigma-70 factor (sigma-E family)